MIVPFIAAVFFGQIPKTFEELEIAKIVAMHDQKKLKLEYSVEMPSDDGKTHKLLYSGIVVDDHSRRSLSVDNEVQVDIITAPPYSWVVIPKEKKYTEIKFTTPKPAQFDPKEYLLKVEPDSFSFKCEDGTVKFGPAKRFAILSIETVHEDKAEYRKITATITSPKTGHVITVTQWFLPDKWIVKRFAMNGEALGGTLSCKGEATVIDFNPKLKASDLTLDMSTVAGFEKTIAGPGRIDIDQPLR